MLKDITLGQYFPRDTVIHRLDPRTKIVLTILYIVALFLTRTWLGYLLAFVVLGAVMVCADVAPKALFRGLRPLYIVILLTALLNIFFTAGTDYAFRWGAVTVTYTGLRNAATMVLRVTFLVAGTFLLTYTTSPLEITDGLERLLSPLKALRVPVYELSLMMSIALRFIPTLIEETDRIMSAQKARGANFETGSLFQRARALMPLLIPLFVSAFRRADELAVAMECRCYDGGKGRTRMKSLCLTLQDGVAFVVGALFLAGVIVLRSVGG